MTPFSRLRELSERSTQIKELNSDAREATKKVIQGSVAGGSLIGGATLGLLTAASRTAKRDGSTLESELLKQGLSPTLPAKMLRKGIRRGATLGAGLGLASWAFQKPKKEFGLLTKNEAAYDKDGHFTGVENHYNGPGITEAAGGAALVGAGLGAGHVGLMRKYGTETLRREKGRFISPKQVQVPVGQAYRKAGSDVLAKIRSLAGKRFSAEDRLKELAGGWAMKDGDKNTIYKEPGVKGHLKRHAGVYISAPLALPSMGIAPLIGAGVDQMRAEGNILKTHKDSVNPLVAKLPKHAKARASHQIYDGRDGTKAYVPLSAKDRLRELAASSTSLKSFDDRRDENGHPIRDAAVGAGLGAGAVMGHRAVMNRYGNGATGLAGAKQAYGAASNDFKGGFTRGYNPPSTSAGAGSVATAATNSPLSADGAKLGGGAAKAGEEASVLTRAGSKAGRLGAVIRGFLSRMR